MATTVPRQPSEPASDPAAAFGRWLGRFDPGPVLVLTHNDADGLSAGAILLAGLDRTRRPAEIRVLGRGETPWSLDVAKEVAARNPAGLVVADLGLRAEPVTDVPTLFVDHHVPRGWPEADVISGYGPEPSPTSSLLAFRAVGAPDDLLWLAALGIVGDMAEAGGFPEMEAARRRYGITALRKAASLVNQPRRSASGDATPALALLRKASGPKAVLSGEHPETAQLLAARDEVRAAAEEARRVAPKLAGEVALIRFASPCQVHPLVAQTWSGRLRDRIVLAANTGFRDGWVHFAARSAADRDLPAFLADRAPPGADALYGSGHRRASGGALRAADWNAFVRGLGFGPETEVPA